MTIQPVSPTSTSSPDQTSSDPVIAQARQMIASNDLKGAIRSLEDLARNQRPASDELRHALIDAHMRYIQQLSTMHSLPPDQLELLNEVLYSHSTRVIDLDANQPEARATRESTLTYYREHQKSPPVMINPTAFYDELLNQKANSTP
jgi:hypothetical protein